MDMKLEVVVVPVSDVDRAKDFDQAPGWRLDADFVTTPGDTDDPPRPATATITAASPPTGAASP